MKTINRNSPLTQREARRLRVVLEAFFKREKGNISQQVATAYNQVTKLDDPRVDLILERIDMEGFTVLFNPTKKILERVTKDGAAKALAQIRFTEEDITNQIHEMALDYAWERAAEMVGKKWVGGELIDNPDPKWAITESTRDFLRNDVLTGLEEGWSSQTLAAVIEDNYAFSGQRAFMVARTEIGNAHVGGSMLAYKESGLVTGKKWLLGSEHDDDDECDANAAAGVIPFDEPFPSGDDAPLAHPNCVCDVIPVLRADEGEES
jgi:hypothetical protein